MWEQVALRTWARACTFTRDQAGSRGGKCEFGVAGNYALDGVFIRASELTGTQLWFDVADQVKQSAEHRGAGFNSEAGVVMYIRYPRPNSRGADRFVPCATVLHLFKYRFVRSRLLTISEEHAKSYHICNHYQISKIRASIRAS